MSYSPKDCHNRKVVADAKTEELQGFLHRSFLTHAANPDAVDVTVLRMANDELLRRAEREGQEGGA